MNNTNSFSMKDIAIGIYDGPHATPPDSMDGPVFLSIDNVTDEGRLNLSEVKNISERDYPRWTKRVTPRKDDIVFSYEATLHRYAILPDGFRGCLGRRMALVRSNQEKVFPRFLHYYFLSRKWRSVIEANIISGATVDRIPIKKFPYFKVNIPALQSQINIAGIVAPYDDLIDTNRRQIQLLEEAARLLFREWFVDFKFPNHKKVKIVDHGGRKMPAEWDYLPLTKIKIFKKAPLGVPVFTDIRQYYQTSEIDDTSITGNGEEVDYENRPSRADIAPRINTIYFAKMKDTDKTLYFNKGNSFLLEKILLSTGMVGFTTDERYLGFLFGLLTSYEFIQFKNNYATGATQVSLNDASLKKIKVLLPSLDLVELFSEIVNPLLEKCSILRTQNQKLAQARDLLLPRLMSGAIEV